VSSVRPNRRIALGGPEVVLHNAAATLPDPPTAGQSVAAWNGQEGSSAEEFELTVTANAATSLTAATLFSIEAGVAIAIGSLNGGAAIALAPTKGFRVRLPHSPRDTVYALSGTFAGANLTVRAQPLRRLE
jgi:hypothetical protein